jgi:hypothetical protein
VARLAAAQAVLERAATAPGTRRPRVAASTHAGPTKATRARTAAAATGEAKGSRAPGPTRARSLRGSREVQATRRGAGARNGKKPGAGRRS